MQKTTKVMQIWAIPSRAPLTLPLAYSAMHIRQLESGLGDQNLDSFPSHDASALLVSRLGLSETSTRHNDRGKMTHHKTASPQAMPAARSSISRLRFGKHWQQCGMTSHSNASLGKQDAASHKVNVPPASWSVRPVA